MTLIQAAVGGRSWPVTASVCPSPGGASGTAAEPRAATQGALLVEASRAVLRG